MNQHPLRKITQWNPSRRARRSPTLCLDTDVPGIARTFFATLARFGNLSSLTFHHRVSQRFVDAHFRRLAPQEHFDTLYLNVNLYLCNRSTITDDDDVVVVVVVRKKKKKSPNIPEELSVSKLNHFRCNRNILHILLIIWLTLLFRFAINRLILNSSINLIII